MFVWQKEFGLERVLVRHRFALKSHHFSTLSPSKQGARAVLEVLRRPCRGMMMSKAPGNIDAPEWQGIIHQLEEQGFEDPRSNLEESWYTRTVVSFIVVGVRRHAPKG